MDYLTELGLFPAFSYYVIAYMQSYTIRQCLENIPTILYLKDSHAWGCKYDKHVGIVESQYYVTKSKNEFS